MKIEFLPEAALELREAVSFYELQVTGLGKVFKTEAKLAIKRISAFSEAWSQIGHGLRKCIMHKFPFNILYSIENEIILIVAIAHHHRYPNYWNKRI